MYMRTIQLTIVLIFALVLLVLLTVWAARLRRALQQNEALRHDAVARAEYDRLLQEAESLRETVRALQPARRE